MRLGSMRYYWCVKICSILARRHIDSSKSWQVAWRGIRFKVSCLLFNLILQILTILPHNLCLLLQLITEILFPDPLNRFKPLILILLPCPPLRPLPLLLQPEYPLLPLHALLLPRVTYLPLVIRVLSLRRPPDREVPLDQPLLQVVPLRDRRVVVLQHFYPVLQLH